MTLIKTVSSMTFKTGSEVPAKALKKFLDSADDDSNVYFELHSFPHDRYANTTIHELTISIEKSDQIA